MIPVQMTNAVTVTNQFFVAKTTVNLTISGSLTGYINPKVFASINPDPNYQMVYSPVSQVINLYTEISNAPYSGNIYLFSDLNGNGWYESGTESIISTNAPLWMNNVSSTNLTLIVTNHL
ncbi:MAG: hypothetical protein A2Y33_11460 [Spirochaetes bacterium GWF1_51_8]|nr:MAG: hypothetical protein A2Y33_11460 [Spirochaetes bacterium GWF1_51_8]